MKTAASETTDLMARIQADLARLANLVHSAPAAITPDDEWPPLPEDPSDPDYVDTATAAARACRSPDTIRTWAFEREIGRTFGGRWRISLRRLKKVTG